jgi:uncharacterized protein (DUF58 family)
MLAVRSLSRSRIYEGEKTEVVLKLENKGINLNFIEVFDRVPDGLAISSGSNHEIVALRTGETYTLTYTISPRVYGFYNIGPTLIRVSDTQGITVRETVYEAISSLKVFPKIQYVPRLSIRPRRTKNWPGEILAKKPGSGLEFYSLREYVDGDPVKRINWKASSKSDETLFTNQFMSELGGDTIIVLDARAESEIGEAPDSTLTYSIRVAAIVAHRLLRDRNRVGMIVIGSTLVKVFPGFGRRQYERIVTELAQTKPGTIWEIRNLGAYLSLFFSKMVQIIVISPLADDNAFESVADVARRGYEVLLISPSPIEIEKRGLRMNDAHRLAERLLRIERESKLDMLRRSIAAVDWNVDTPLSTALQEATHAWNKQVA